MESPATATAKLAVDVTTLSRRALQHLAIELQLCRGNVKSDVIQQHVADYMQTHGDDGVQRVAQLVEDMPEHLRMRTPGASATPLRRKRDVEQSNVTPRAIDFAETTPLRRSTRKTPQRMMASFMRDAMAVPEASDNVTRAVDFNDEAVEATANTETVKVQESASNADNTDGVLPEPEEDANSVSPEPAQKKRRLESPEKFAAVAPSPTRTPEPTRCQSPTDVSMGAEVSGDTTTHDDHPAQESELSLKTVEMEEAMKLEEPAGESAIEDLTTIDTDAVKEVEFKESCNAMTVAVEDEDVVMKDAEVKGAELHVAGSTPKVKQQCEEAHDDQAATADITDCDSPTDQPQSDVVELLEEQHEIKEEKPVPEVPVAPQDAVVPASTNVSVVEPNVSDSEIAGDNSPSAAQTNDEPANPTDLSTDEEKGADSLTPESKATTSLPECIESQPTPIETEAVASKHKIATKLWTEPSSDNGIAATGVAPSSIDDDSTTEVAATSSSEKLTTTSLSATNSSPHLQSAAKMSSPVVSTKENLDQIRGNQPAKKYTVGRSPFKVINQQPVPKLQSAQYAKAVKELVASNCDLAFTSNRRVRCLLTKHEMKADVATIQAHISGKRYLRIKSRKASFKQFEPMFTEHPDEAQKSHLLWCNVTDTVVPRDTARVEAHIRGVRYQKELPLWQEAYDQMHRHQHNGD